MHSRMQLVVLQKRMRPTMRANQWEMVRAAASEAPKLDARVKPRFFMMMTAALPMLIWPLNSAQFVNMPQTKMPRQ